MKFLNIFFLVTFFLQGCIYKNEKGFSTTYYNDCVEYYDAQGIYHKKCNRNLLNDTKIKSWFTGKKKRRKKKVHNFSLD